MGFSIKNIIKHPLGTLVGGALGGAILGPIGGLIGAGLGSQAGNNPFHPPETNLPNAPSWSADQSALQQQQQQQQALFNAYQGQIQGLVNPMESQVSGLSGQLVSDTSKRYSDQQTALKNALDKYRQNAEQNLTTGQEGEALRQEYNRLGLLNSGAFNSALADKFGQIQQNTDLALMQQGLQSTDAQQQAALQGFGAQNQANQLGFAVQQQGLQSGFDTQSQLGLSGLQRQYGLEDQQYQGLLNAILAKRQDQSQTKNNLLGIGGGILGSILGRR